MNRRLGIPRSLTAALSAALVAATAAGAASASPTMMCHANGGLVRMAELPEASGLAISRVTPGRLWTHNDSGAPFLFALDVRATP